MISDGRIADAGLGGLALARVPYGDDAPRGPISASTTSGKGTPHA
ncbi:hypothetical protein ABZ915_00355 [Streptomyces sp. NPDC046915]